MKEVKYSSMNSLLGTKEGLLISFMFWSFQSDSVPKSKRQPRRQKLSPCTPRREGGGAATHILNLSATDFFFQILAHPVFKMRVIQKPKKVAL